MKKTLLFVFIISFQIVNAQVYMETSNNLFRVSGDAILRVPPNQVVLSLGVESRGKALAPTKQKNADIMQKAMGFCKKEGVPEKYIQTDYIRINPHYEYRNEVTIDYYSVNQSISVVIDDLDKYELILTELLNIGINQVNDIEFRTTELKEHRFKVRKMAIEAAKEKAEFLTKEVEIELDKIINIEESTNNPVNSFSRSNYANLSQNIVQNTTAGIDGSSLSVGLLSLKATITLTYSLKE